MPSFSKSSLIYVSGLVASAVSCWLAFQVVYEGRYPTAISPLFHGLILGLIVVTPLVTNPRFRKDQSGRLFRVITLSAVISGAIYFVFQVLMSA